MATNQSSETPEPKKHPFGLSDRHYKFGLALLKYGNQTTAYMAVYGPDNKNLIPANARTMASDLLRTDPNVRLFLASRLKKHELDVDRILAHDALMANYDASDMFDEDDNLLPASQWGDMGRIVQGVTERTWTDRAGVTQRERTVKLADRNKAKDRLYKYLRLFPDQAIDPIEVQSAIIRAWLNRLSPADQAAFKAEAIQEIARLKARKPLPAIDLTPEGPKKGKTAKRRGRPPKQRP